MDNVVEIPQAQVEMAYVTTCIEAPARRLGTSYREVYDRMERVGMIDGYIYPCYSTLHTESRENIVEDLLACAENVLRQPNLCRPARQADRPLSLWRPLRGR